MPPSAPSSARWMGGDGTRGGTRRHCAEHALAHARTPCRAPARSAELVHWRGRDPERHVGCVAPPSGSCAAGRHVTGRSGGPPPCRRLAPLAPGARACCSGVRFCRFRAHPTTFRPMAAGASCSSVPGGIDDPAGRGDELVRRSRASGWARWQVRPRGAPYLDRIRSSCSTAATTASGRSSGTA